MGRKAPPRTEDAKEILEIVKNQRRKNLKTDAIKRVSEAIRKIWESPIGVNSGELSPRSVDSRSKSSELSVIDHPIPQCYFSSFLLSVPREDLRTPYFEALLHKNAFYCLISTDEKERLKEHELSDSMPDNWNGIDRFARYQIANICMGEVKKYSREELKIVLVAT